MAEGQNGPHQFELIGKDTQISYSTSSFCGRPQLSYQHLDQHLSFQGDQIGVLSTDIDRLVSVTIDQTPDRGSVTLTLLLPEINLRGKEARFRTRAILTTSPGTTCRFAAVCCATRVPRGEPARPRTSPGNVAL